MGDNTNKVNGNFKLLKPSKNDIAYLKMGVFGDTGSGKTWTASNVAVGLHKHIKSNKPAAFFDTEGGSTFVRPTFEKAGIELMTIKSRSANDLHGVIKEAERGCSVLIIDSISHVWDEFTDAYLKKSKSKYIELWDWKPVKTKWREMITEPYVNADLHIIMCGRESGIYRTEEVEKGGKIRKETLRVGDKMKAEAETGYEPSLLCQMQKIHIGEKGEYKRRCHVVKERFNVIDSKDFDNPTFNDFLPHIKLLNIGGSHGHIANNSTSESFFEGFDYANAEYKRDCEIALEEIQAAFTSNGVSSRTKDGGQKINKILEQTFGTASWTAIKNKKLDELKKGLPKIMEALSCERT